MTQTTRLETVSIAHSTGLSGTVWLDDTRRADLPQTRLKGPHFPIRSISLDEFEGWSQLDAWMGAEADTPRNFPRQPSPQVFSLPNTLSTHFVANGTSDSLPHLVMNTKAADGLHAVAAAPESATIPQPHLDWKHVTRQQFVGKHWNHWQPPTAPPNVQTPHQQLIHWPAITDRLLSVAPEAVAEIVAALLKLKSKAPPIRDHSRNSQPVEETPGFPPGFAVLITAKAPDQGGTTTAIVLSRYLAQRGHRILLVDADIVTAGLSRALGLIGTLNDTISLAAQVEALSHRRLVHASVPAGQLDIMPTVCRQLALANTVTADEHLIQSVAKRAAQYDLAVIDAGPLVNPTLPEQTSRFQRWARLANVGLVVRRPSAKCVSSSTPVESALASWGLKRLLIANIAPPIDEWS